MYFFSFVSPQRDAGENLSNFLVYVKHPPEVRRHGGEQWVCSVREPPLAKKSLLGFHNLRSFRLPERIPGVVEAEYTTSERHPKDADDECPLVPDSGNSE